MASLKQGMKNILIKKQHKIYERTVFETKLSYSEWIAKQEKKIKIDGITFCKKRKSLTNETEKEINGRFENGSEGFPSSKIPPFQYFEVVDHERIEQNEENDKKAIFMLHSTWCATGIDQSCFEIVKNSGADVLLFVLSEGELSEIAIPLIYKKFKENKDTVLIYGDEDVRKSGKREKPWFKPDWSPDTFLSYFYFGSLVAVRKKTFEEAFGEYNRETDLYRICLKIIEKHGKKDSIFHIPEVLFHSRKEGYETVKKLKLPENLVHGREVFERKPMVSIIIPSKDNPKVLFTCIHSLIEKTKTSYPFEILVVDNGSSVENRQMIEKEMDDLNREKGNGEALREIRYLYEPMTFNFSRMCNLGASMANGRLYLFLNDDMEIIKENWLTLLADKAVLPHAGAVGAKLLYPDSDIIQHAGITNLRVGPAHKLQYLSDQEVHYYGKNRGVHNMMAVTGACLLLRKELFEKTGGFSEELAVAFNDVDLCYTIYEMGYYNIVRNDVVLYHHESLSRGKDGDSEEKQQRLLREKDILYERHQGIYGKDPFYHKYLTMDMLEPEYSPAFRYQVTLDMPWSMVTGSDVLPKNIKADQCVVIGMECAMDIYKWKYGVSADKGRVRPRTEDMGYYFQGYSFVIGSDNACYKKTLLLQNKVDMTILRISLEERYRPDIKNNLKDQINVDLTGFAAKVQLDSIPKGIYRFGMLVEDRCSRQKLVNWSSWTLDKKE